MFPLRKPQPLLSRFEGIFTLPTLLEGFECTFLSGSDKRRRNN